MKLIVRTWSTRLAVLCASLALSGCLATQGVVVPKKPEGAVAPSTRTISTTQSTTQSTAATTVGDSRVGSPEATNIRAEVQCKTPAENYDFSATVFAKFGAEGKARIERLLSTNFASASLTPEDREILAYTAKEMLWIPVPVEETIGTALLLVSNKELTVLSNEGSNKVFWTKTVAMVSELSNAGPPNPFKIRLILLQMGTPGSLAGGVIFIDNETLKSVFDDDTDGAQEKLRFIVAHELAHIAKRHRAKRIQQLLVDSDSGLRLMRQIVTRGQGGGGASTPAAFGEWIQTVAAIPHLAQDLMKQHEKYGLDQEYEADACATAMMMDGNLGNPVRAFQAYRKDAAQIAATAPATGAVGMAGASVRTHPPDALREANIEKRMRAYQGTMIASQPLAPKVTEGGAKALNSAAPPLRSGSRKGSATSHKASE
ncbi:M48 family metalloprotease [Variovorax sp. J22R115]|uniref:M48 family metalloprotease n=1 Tax=Variovorax sp. J22R115 TaxID=3053509 RepID=UPI002575B1AA|nr:M48 family metalloprotease [Variovorax sp. J22R115]MDM0053517.1 M48 family metalloprotease [Variovorax sp. J22R115]